MELSKRSRTVKSDSKGKGKLQETVYDHSESSLHDEALRSRLLLAYEAFIVNFATEAAIDVNSHYLSSLLTVPFPPSCLLLAEKH